MFSLLNAVYDASCEYSTKALFWIFCCAIILGTFGMVMLTFRASLKLTVDNTPDPPPNFNTPKRAGKAQGDNERPEVNQHGTPEYPVQATPYATVHTPPVEAPPGEVRVDDSMNDDVYTAYTAPTEFPPPGGYPTRGSHYRDNDTVTMQKRANAVDVD